MADAGHSKHSASGFEAAMLCPGKSVLERGLPNRASKYSAEGTAAHQVLTWALQEKLPASAYVGRVIEVEDWVFDVDDEMAGHVQVCIDYCLDAAGADGVIFADIKVCYADYLSVPRGDAWGTSDVIILKGNEIIVVDFKYGQGVEVKAGKDFDCGEAGHDGGACGTSECMPSSPLRRRPNPQMALYALGALDAYNGVETDYARVRLVISQPRISVKPSEYDLSVAELEAWGYNTARSAVCSKLSAESLSNPGEDPYADWVEAFLRPGEKQCKFCRAKATCPALRDEVSKTLTVNDFTAATPGEFADMELDKPDDAEWLSVSLSKVDLIEDWCKAVRAEVEHRLLAGDTIPGFKLVEGKQGNRAWADERAAERYLVDTVRLKKEDLYDFSVKSPTQIAKLGPAFDKDGKVKPVKEGAPAPLIGPRQWPKVQALITRAPPKKHVAPLSDPRPALDIKQVADEFQAVQPATDEEFA